MKTRLLLLASALLLSAEMAMAQDYSVPVSEKNEKMMEGKFKPTWESLRNYKVPEWFRNAKFGIWAHWGPQCVEGSGDWMARELYFEGSRAYNHHVKHYGHPSEVGFKDIIPLFKAERWDPDKLVALYKKIGAQYFFALGNHHDNMDLWDSQYQPWNSVNMGPKRDILAEWEKAARKYELPFGISFHADHAWTWYEPSQRYDREGPKAGIPYDEMKEPLDKLLSKLNEIRPVAEELDAYYKSKGYTTDNYAKEQQLGPKYVQLYEQFVPIYADFDNLMHKINLDRLQQRLQELRDAGKKNAAAAQEVSLRLTAVLEKLDSEKEPDVNAINQELQAIGDLANGISSPTYDSVKTSVNSTIGAIRTYMGSKQDNDYKHMVEAYNRYISNMNTTNMNELDQ